MKLTAKDVMSSQPVTLRTEMTCNQAAEVLAKHQITGAPVVDRSGSLLGVMTIKDLLRAEIPIRYPSCFYTQSWLDEVMGNFTCPSREGHSLVSDFFHRETYTAYPDTSVAVLAEQMLKRQIHRIIIIQPDTQKPIGIVTAFDLLKVIVREQNSETERVATVLS